MRADQGLKRKVAQVLQGQERAMTMGELMLAADVSKAFAADVSSALDKLVRQGLVEFKRGPATARSGPRLVRRFIWVVAGPEAKGGPQTPANPFSGLGLNIIGR